MLRIFLKEAMHDFERRSGCKLTYEQLAAATGLSVSTLQSIASRAAYNPRLSTISTLCEALDCGPEILLRRTPIKVK
ncbi:transcriptional regulator [Hyphomonas oceanitis SCH89]|uniref:Transcriptional regulator n=2 Tax=Hyphomonas oceanitis TaxID=81033 RepID=A0A059G2M7_9PROT|nr:transcriptional regulator [Hyphomonas oceanitis SCH89]|tara:strand:+ start:179 stop:409 length:231 start_codon:yes stop_codon:yes gene_type:complete